MNTDGFRSPVAFGLPEQVSVTLPSLSNRAVMRRLIRLRFRSVSCRFASSPEVGATALTVLDVVVSGLERPA